LPNDLNWIGKIVQDICYNNAQNYFNWHLQQQPATVKVATA
jgi:glucuronate isomerase